jgi:Cu-Zn family superoxide dismutase
VLKLTLGLAVTLLLLLSPTVATAQTPSSATADLRTADGQSIATATFTRAPQETLISIAFTNRTALVGAHALHIHAVGRCDPPAFTSAGAAQIPLPNLVIGPDGVGVYNLAAPQTSLDSLIGRSLVVLQQPDDTSAQANANTSPRIACGVIADQRQSTDRPDVLTSVAIVVLGGLLIAGGILLRRRT